MCLLCLEVISVTLYKLSLRNARRQAKDYLVYFVTIIVSSALLYAFNGLVFSDEIRNLSYMMKNLPIFIFLASIAAIFIIGWLVHYTTGFMLLRRSRELGTYILTGLEPAQVSRLFFLENLIVGGLAFIPGVFLGSLIFQALRAVILSLFQAPYTFSFSFMPKALGLTLLYFLLIYLSAQLKGNKRIRSMKIYDLIYFDRQNEKAFIQTGRIRRRIFTISILLGIFGTILMTLGELATGLFGAACTIIFLFGFFISFSSGVPAWFEKRPEKKYAGVTLLIFRTLSSKLATMGVVMATISLLYTAVLIAQGTGMTFAAIFENRAEQVSAFDLFISAKRPDVTLPHYMNYIRDNIPVKDSLTYRLYQGNTTQISKYIKPTDYFIPHCDMLMRFSDYTALRTMLGYSEVTLAPGEYLIHCMPHLKKKVLDAAPVLNADGNSLQPGAVFTENFNQRWWDQANGSGFIMVVPDELAEKRPVCYTLYAAMLKQPASEDQYQALDKLRNTYCQTEYDTLHVRAHEQEESAYWIAAIVFPLYYLALILTMTASAILTIRQLAENERYKHQFTLLDKLGMEPGDMKKALRRQLAIYYIMPAIPPVLIGVPLILSVGNAVEPGTLTGASQPLVIIGISLGLFFLIYFIYILMAYISLKRNVLPA